MTSFSTILARVLTLENDPRFYRNEQTDTFFVALERKFSLKLALCFCSNQLMITSSLLLWLRRSGLCVFCFFAVVFPFSYCSGCSASYNDAPCDLSRCVWSHDLFVRMYCLFDARLYALVHKSIRFDRRQRTIALVLFLWAHEWLISLLVSASAVTFVRNSDSCA
jgi:hypothetical protein